jgi:ABC-type sugar transport system permease subunit
MSTLEPPVITQRTVQPPAPLVRTRARGRRRRARGDWQDVPRGMVGAVALSLLPAVVLFGVFFLIPLGVLVVTSLGDWSSLGFALHGLGNYADVLKDPAFARAARNTALFAAAGVFIQVPIGCLVGILLAQHRRGWKLLRTVIFMPFVISGAAYALVFSLVYNPRYGLLNSGLRAVGLGGDRDWLFDVGTALPAVAGTFILIIGFIVVLVMAEIAAIPRELHEAADVDGASGLQRQLYITLPLLRHVIGTCVLITLLVQLALFDLVYILTEGGPNDATVTLTLYAFRAYSGDDWGHASTAGVLIVLIGLLLILIARRAFRIGERDL